MSLRISNFVLTTASVLMLFLGFVYFLAESGKSQGPVGDPHKDTPCSNGHQLVAKVGDAGFSRDDLNKSCRKCHQNALLQISDSRLSFHSDISRPCLDCHFFHKKSVISARGHEFELDIEKASQKTLCLSCHGANQDIGLLSPGHREAAKIYHSDPKFLYGLSPSQTCLLCHSEDARIDNNLVNATHVPRFSEHSNHPVGIEINRHGANSKMIMRDKIDPRLQFLNNKIECQTCHSLTSTKKGLLAGFDSTNDLCRGCHLVG